MEKLDTYTDKAVELALSYGPKLVLAILTLIIGLWLIKILMRLMDKAMDRAKVDVTLQRFLMNLLSVIFKALLLISVVSMIGVETTSFIAMLGAMGLALQGSLANFAGGALILFFKPFKAGDLIEAQGYTGAVEEIQIFNTILITLDNQKVVIPNGLLSNGCLKNLFSVGTRRIDMTYSIGYDDDLLHAKEVLRALTKTDERILQDPVPEVYVSAHADSSINFLARVWANSDDYWPVYFNMNE